jgi:hypothetical protein
MSVSLLGSFFRTEPRLATTWVVAAYIRMNDHSQAHASRQSIAEMRVDWEPIRKFRSRNFSNFGALNVASCCLQFDRGEV